MPRPALRGLARALPPFQIPRQVPIAPRRHASTYPSFPRRFLSGAIFLSATGAFIAYYYDSRSVLHEHIIMPIMRLTDPETGHKAAIRLLSSSAWFRPGDRALDQANLSTELFGLPVSNPVGMAAGFDKDADAIDGLFDLGFGYVEVGSVTPEPQPGNPKPRFFRLPEDQAAINRYGFNSLGHGHTLSRLKARLISFSQSNPGLFPSPLPLSPLPPPSLPRSLHPGHLLAVNLGKNKTSAADSNEDYVRGVRILGPYADIVVVNVSSPNTPGLRALQGREILEKLLLDVREERDRIAINGLPKLAVKVACDLSEEELGDVAAAVRNSGVDGVIVSNTTIRRAELNLASSYQDQVGGLSGRPLFPYALSALKTLRPLLPPSIPIIGCGGISSGEDALAMARAGASLIQVYTSFGYRGVGTPRLIKDEISTSLGESSWKSQIGRDWAGEAMGWDEKRLQREAERVRKEAEDLGEILRRAREEDDTAHLIELAEQALAMGSRDNQLGAEQVDPAPVVAEIGQLLENASPVAAPQGLIEASTIEEVVVPTPQPRIIDVVPEPPQNEWTSSVHSGQRRLV